MEKEITKSDVENLIKLLQLLKKIEEDEKNPNIKRPPEGCMFGRNGEIIRL